MRNRVSHVVVVSFTAILVALVAQRSIAAHGPSPLNLSFNGSDYSHRWSKDNQHEFTPAGEEDLEKWTNMITINVHDSARTGDQLADVANRVLANYQSHGKVVRTSSVPRTKDAEAQHFAVAVLGNPKFLEAAFARFLLHDGRGVVVVYSKRIYGAKAGDEMSAWLQQHGPEIEKTLLAWNGLPSLAALKALPESR